MTHEAVLATSLPKLMESVKLGDGAIDSKLSGLVLMQADEDWTDEELAQIDTFMMHGHKTLLVVAGAVNLRPGDASMHATLSSRRIGTLLGKYGVDVEAALVDDPAARVGLAVGTPSGKSVTMASPGVIQLAADPAAGPATQTLDGTFAGWATASEIVFPFPSPLTVKADRQPEAMFSVVARSSKQSTTLNSAELALKPSIDVTSSTAAGQHVLAVSVTGTLNRAFPASDGETSSAPGSRILVIAAPQLFHNPYRRAGTDDKGEVVDTNLSMLGTAYASSKLSGSLLLIGHLAHWMVSDANVTECNQVQLTPPK